MRDVNVNTYLVVVHCPEPQCSNLGSQSYTFDLGRLKVMLRNDEEIQVVGEICHHTWSLSRSTKDMLKTLLGCGSV